MILVSIQRHSLFDNFVIGYGCCRQCHNFRKIGLNLNFDFQILKTGLQLFAISSQNFYIGFDSVLVGTQREVVPSKNILIKTNFTEIP